MATYAKARERRRSALLTAGRLVMAEKGVEATSIADIASRAGVSPGTFYNYFPDVSALLDVIVDEMLAELDADLRAIGRLERSHPERFVLGIAKLLDKADDDPVWAWCMVRFEPTVAKLREALTERVSANIEAGIDAGVYRPAARGRVVADLLIGTVTMSTLSRLDGRTHRSDNGAVAELLLRALGTAPRTARAAVRRALGESIAVG